MEKLGLVETTNERTPFIEQSKGGKFLDFYRRHKVVVTIGAIMILLLPLLGLLALRNRGARAEWTSPLVYPSRMLPLRAQGRHDKVLRLAKTSWLTTHSPRIWCSRLGSSIQQSPESRSENDPRGDEQHHARSFDC
jgi:hypothetical protein